jgi:hypothetical protein
MEAAWSRGGGGTGDQSTGTVRRRGEAEADQALPGLPQRAGVKLNTMRADKGQRARFSLAGWSVPQAGRS